MKVLAQECGPHRIRVNAVCPTTVHTPLVINDATFELFAPDKENPGEDDVREAFEGLNILPGVAWIEPSDVSDAVVFCARMPRNTSPASRSRSTPATPSKPECRRVLVAAIRPPPEPCQDPVRPDGQHLSRSSALDSRSALSGANPAPRCTERRCCFVA